MNTHEILLKARELISDPARWTRGANARSDDGHITTTCDPEARCWCAAGAVVRVSLTGHHSESTAVFDALRSQIKGWSGAYNAGVSDYNDAHTHAEVLAMFDRAIEATKS